MGSVIELARPEIQQLVPYEAANYAEGLVLLNANETPWPAPGSPAEADLNHYPPEKPDALRAALAEYYGVTAEQTLVTRGSSEAIDLLIRCFCTAGQDSIVICPPTFGMYRVYADVQGAGVHEIPLLAEQGYALDADNIVRNWPDDAKVLFICSPNNPTGNRFETAEIDLIARLLSGRALVVVDAAYTEFGSDDPTHQLLNSTEFNNVVVLRTLSKAFGLAGARCGALLGPPELVRMAGCVMPPYALAKPVIEAVQACLTPAARDEIAERVSTLRAERERVAAALSAMPGVEQVYPSEANFLLVRVSDSKRFAELAMQGGVLVRNFGWQVPNCLRITIGNEAQNNQLIDSLKQL
ncbi:MAG: histidinol-phosphate transaminase [Gammaproteobacteria bacterium]|nr:histidinol-phosphate transaminase [Gammaproteobacteria bacterium]